MTMPIAITGLGMVSCLAQGAKENSAAMRCSYSNFQPIEFYIQNNSEQLLGATATRNIFTGLEHLIEISKAAIDNILNHNNHAFNTIPLIVILPTEKETPLTWKNDYCSIFFNKLQDLFKDIKFSSNSSYHRCGKAGLKNGISQTRSILYDKNQEHVLLLCVDSLLNNHRISLYENYNDTLRLLTENNPDGFIPGEAAIALLLSKPDGTKQTCITGIGHGKEKATIGSDAVLKSEGASNAIKMAAKNAGCKVRDTDFIISSVSGESYFFKEVSIARTKSLEQKVATHPLWHPADNIGEVGAAVGGAMIVMGHYAFEGNYAPGNRAVCLLSNDDENRAAFILERLGV